jgi:predicted dehydrogenase
VIFVPSPFTPTTPAIELRRPDAEPEAIPVEDANAYRLELENVGAAIRGEAPLLLGRDDAIAQARTIEALYQSAETAAPTSDRSTA